LWGWDKEEEEPSFNGQKVRCEAKETKNGARRPRKGPDAWRVDAAALSGRSDWLV
jgi:hypothetical protein